MTAETSNFVPVVPRKGTAPAPAAAAPEETDEALLRAQPHARARARQIVTGAGRAVAEKRTARRVAATAGKAPRDVVDDGVEGRANAWNTRPPSLAELADRARTGPTIVRTVDGKTVVEDVDWHGLQVFAWKLWTWGAVVVAAPAYGVVWAVQKPSRSLGLAVLVAIAWALTKGGAA